MTSNGHQGFQRHGNAVSYMVLDILESSNLQLVYPLFFSDSNVSSWKPCLHCLDSFLDQISKFSLHAQYWACKAMKDFIQSNSFEVPNPNSWTFQTVCAGIGHCQALPHTKEKRMIVYNKHIEKLEGSALILIAKHISSFSYADTNRMRCFW